MQGRSELGNAAYHGPCPDKGDSPHRYTFTIYALSVEKLEVPPDFSGTMVVSTAKDHLLGKAVFIAHYGKIEKASIERSEEEVVCVWR